jgi:hypothetical protein
MDPSKFSKPAIAGIALLVAFSLLMLNQLPRADASASAQAESTPVMMKTSDRLVRPPTVYPPTQADQGAQVYFLVCMTCHGDKGQGLTEEWRNSLGAPDNNCWQSRCHAPNHPPDGFVLPKVVPPVVSPSILPNYQTAKGLHDFIALKMPWQAPGTLTKDEYWQLTAFVMRLNGADPGKRILDEPSAAAISFGKAGPPPADVGTSGNASSRYYFLVAGAITAALIVLLVMVRRRKE